MGWDGDEVLAHGSVNEVLVDRHLWQVLLRLSTVCDRGQSYQPVCAYVYTEPPLIDQLSWMN
jgi:hypothetical protein